MKFFKELNNLEKSIRRGMRSIFSESVDSVDKEDDAESVVSEDSVSVDEEGKCAEKDAPPELDKAKKAAAGEVRQWGGKKMVKQPDGTWKPADNAPAAPSSPSKKSPDSMTLADHAEAWHKEQGKEVPKRGTPEWDKMYENWHSFAFRDFGKKNKSFEERLDDIIKGVSDAS